MSHKPLTDTELDALVVRELSRLARVAPPRGFSDRVMTRVALPAPRPVVLYRRARAWAFQPQRALALAGSYVVAAGLALALAVPWVIRNSSTLLLGVDWAASRAAELVRGGSLALASLLASMGLYDAVSGVVPDVRLWVAAAGLACGYAGCAAGLHKLIRISPATGPSA